MPRSRQYIVDTLLGGLQRLEYRGYDSAGVAFDGSNECSLSDNQKRPCLVVRQKGKVAELERALKESMGHIDWSLEFDIHAGIAHTRWATHGPPSPVNSHPQRSDENNEFVVVHNGIINNYKDLKAYLEKKGYRFESETDTEVVVKLIKYIFDKHRAQGEKLSFQQLIAMVISQLEGAFSLLFKSVHYPGELAASRRGSPLLVGVKCEGELGTNHIPILFSKVSGATERGGEPEFHATGSILLQSPLVRPEQQLEAEFHPLGSNKKIEYFFASDASAIIEHTNQVIFLEDDDVAVVRQGRLTLHRVQKGGMNEPTHREIQALYLELQQIMKVRLLFNNTTLIYSNRS